jgi:hypothetical protein
MLFYSSTIYVIINEISFFIFSSVINYVVSYCDLLRLLICTSVYVNVSKFLVNKNSVVTTMHVLLKFTLICS